MIIGTDRIHTSSGDVLESELFTTADRIASVSQVSTPATGSNGTQFTFKNAAGNAIASKRGMLMFVSDVNGVPATAVTSVATLTNGKVVTLATGAVAFVETTAAGLLGVTLTMTTGSYYLSFVLPNHSVITSTVLTCN